VGVEEASLTLRAKKRKPLKNNSKPKKTVFGMMRRLLKNF
jgi:hypothetical protein